MTRREQLQERYEDALFALLMDDYAVLEGEKALQENERLKVDPTAAVPEGTKRRCKKTIQKSFAADKARSARRITMKVIQHVAVVGFAVALLFTVAFAASSDFRISTLNFVIDAFDDRAVFYAGNEVPSIPQSIEAKWLPQGYSLAEINQDKMDAVARYRTDDGKEIEISLFDVNGSKAFDTEDAEVAAVIINNYEAVTIVKCGIDGYGNAYKRSQVVWFDTLSVCGVSITSYQEGVKTLVQVAENLILK